MSTQTPRIILSMIVKNESAVIERCLASVRPIISGWHIVDTGSTDGTQQVIQSVMQDIPGSLHERPWVDFAHNRTEALAFARPHGDYTLIIDADDVLVLSPEFTIPTLDADTYLVEIHHHELRHMRPHVINSALPWRYEGVIHEFLSVAEKDGRGRRLPEQMRQKTLPGAHILIGDDGARRQTDQITRYSHDAMVITKALERERDPLLRSRYTFYLGQSLQNAGDSQRALEAYRQRATMGFWVQEVFVSLFRVAQILEQTLGHGAHDTETVIAAYQAAHSACPSRGEALHGAARFCRQRKLFQQGYLFARRADKIPRPRDGFLLQTEVYDWQIADELGVNAYWAGHYKECLDACIRALSSGLVPEVHRPRMLANIDHALRKLAETQTNSVRMSAAPGKNQSRRRH